MNTGKVFGYARVSSREQNLDRQIEALREYGVEERDIISDKASGKDFNREGYKVLKNSMLREGDTLVVKELDRLGRNMKQIKEEWNELQKAGVDIVVIDTPLLNTKEKSDLEKTLISNIVFELLTYLAEKERQKIKARQEEGIKIAKEQGKNLGRPKAEYPKEWDKVYAEWKANEISAKVAMETLQLKRTTFYKLVEMEEMANELQSWIDNMLQGRRFKVMEISKSWGELKEGERIKREKLFKDAMNIGKIKGIRATGKNDQNYEVYEKI